MARIRSVHPGLFTDEVFVSLSVLARIFLIGLWTECDDQGVFSWRPITLKMRLLAAEAADVVALLDELLSAGIVRSFSVDDHMYGAVRNFQRFQRPKKPRSIYPLPGDLVAYVGGSCLADQNEGDEDRDTGSPPVPHQFPTSGEKSPQMEEGEEKEGKEDSASLRSAAAIGQQSCPISPDESPPGGAEPDPEQPSAPKGDPPAGPIPIRDRVWQDGVPIVRGLVGCSEAQARALLGRMLKASHDDCARVYAALREAESLRPMDPRAWLMRAAEPPEERRDARWPPPPRSRRDEGAQHAMRLLGLLPGGRPDHPEEEGRVIDGVAA